MNWPPSDYLFSLLQALAMLFTAGVAYAALHTWKHQARTQKQTEFLDELTDAVHEYIQHLHPAVDYLQLIQISYESYKNSNNCHANDRKYSHVVAYIQSNGVRDSSELSRLLDTARDRKAKVQSLLARGQIYDFAAYDLCKESIDMLLWQHDRLQVVAATIGRPSLDWDHPLAVKSIENLLTVQRSDIQEDLHKYNSQFLEFVSKRYKDAYSKS